MRAVAGKIWQYKPKNVVIDPVMYAKNGCPLMNPNATDELVLTIIPLADILTPNIPEAEKIAGMTIENVKNMEEAARQIHSMGCRNVLVKGGHALKDTDTALDILFDGENLYRFEAPRIDTKNTHGTGCTYSSAIASNLALGLHVKLAIASAKVYVTTAIRHSLPIGKGHGPIHHFYDLYKNN
jgi:hydroxymethylpyrimidine/phosphomethylpyrimidine kinase